MEFIELFEIPEHDLNLIVIQNLYWLQWYVQQYSQCFSRSLTMECRISAVQIIWLASSLYILNYRTRRGLFFIL